ncbi:MAG: outer membrane beta-barrel protein [Flavobacterium micromati]|nr:outer membrane beta-barrel protein [Flavobacterium micromati]
MKKKLFLLGFMICSMIMTGQNATQEKWYFKLGGSYFTQTAATEFPVVSGQLPNTDVYATNGTTLLSRETNHGSFGEGFRTGLTAGYRVSSRLGFEMGVNYFKSSSKTMVETVNKLAASGPVFVTGRAQGKITAFDLAPAVVLFLGESNGFEPYTKVGVIVPVSGDLTIETNRTYTTPAGNINSYAKEKVLPNPTVGFMAVLGTSYKLGKNISVYGELEYRNFTVHGKSKETEVYNENGVDKLNTATAFRPDASYSLNHVNYVEQINTTSNNKLTNSAGFDSTKASDDISSYVGISGLGLTLGLKYSL